MEKILKNITFANMRSCGKSSLARLLAEKLKTSILNFDTERDSEHYNTIHTINIKPNKSITRDNRGLILSDETVEQIISSKSGYLICDLGGYFDKRVIEIESDYYIIPSFHDYESMRESMRTANYILKYQPRAKIIFILNGAFIRNADDKEKYIANWQEQIDINGLSRFLNLYLPYSKLMTKLVDEEVTRDKAKTKDGAKIRYDNIDNLINQIVEHIGKGD